VSGERDRSTAFLLSHQTDFLIGWCCEDKSQRHRSLLRALLIEKGTRVKYLFGQGDTLRSLSPCFKKVLRQGLTPLVFFLIYVHYLS
jgi:hypothetical protein